MEAQKKHVHFIGIGGTGMSAIALVLLQSGYTVSGSDRQISPLAHALQNAGAVVYAGHQPENVRGAHLVVRSSAVMDDNPEVIAARAAGIPVLKRIDFLAQVTAGKKVVAVAGTHGKTTTTSMIAWMLTACGKDPSYIIGGVPANLGANAHAGKGEIFVIEADEYDRMFLGLQPDVAVITNVEHDHPDCYPTPQEFYQAFLRFASQTAPAGTLLACADDPGAARLLAEIQEKDIHAFSYGLTPGCTYQAQNLLFDTQRGGYRFDIFQKSTDQNLGEIALQVPGKHNVLNACAALAVAQTLHIATQDAARALANYLGTGRRFEVRGSARGITIIDDYAHHPTEIQTTLAAARQRFAGQPIWVVWQPHTFSRSRSLFERFCASFHEADHLLITEIYAAREPVPADFSALHFVQAIQKTGHPDVRLCASLSQATDTLLSQLHSGDVLLVLSAGDAEQISAAVLAGLHPPVPSHPQHTQIRRALAKFGERLQFDVSLARYNTMRTGGAADALLLVHSAIELAQAAALLWQSRIPFTVLGSGSNVLVNDGGFRGVVLINQAQQVIFHDDTAGQSVWAESGANLGLIARQAAQRGLSGLEWAAGIPGTLGGAVVGNAGAHGSEIAKDLIVAEILHRDIAMKMDVDTLDEQTKAGEAWTAQQMEFVYRSSALKRNPGTAIVLAAQLRLHVAELEQIQARMEDYLSRRRRLQPTGASLGSIFKNRPGDHAGRLIEACGLKGKRIGGVEISPLHANFFISDGSASAQDVCNLIRLAQHTVAEKFGVHLETEIEWIGDWT